MGALCGHKAKGSLVVSSLSADGDGDGDGYGVHVVVVTLLLWVTAVGRAQVAAGQLAVGFYASSCPGAERIITTAVRTASVVDPVLPAKILRLFFHDCFVEGCDGSLLLDSAGNQTAEKDDPINKTVEGYNLVDGIKRSMELLCPGIVSCADIVALAASAAVLQVGGPNVRIATGRLDGKVSNGGLVRFNLPDTNFDLDMLLEFFGAKGLDLTDIVTLAGAHTIGVAHCDAFNDRIVFNNSVALVDPTMNPDMVEELISKCPAQADPSTTVTLDTTTPSTFDNAYYSNLQTGRGLMTADQSLFTDPRSKPTVERFATDRAAFFASWADAFTKLSMVNVKTGTDPSGEIRKACRAVNS